MTKLWTSDLKPILEELKQAFDSVEKASAREVLRVLEREETRFRGEGHDIPKEDTFGCEFWMLRARALARLGRLDAAVEAITGVPEGEENHEQIRGRAYVLRAEWLARRGDVDRAIWDARATVDTVTIGSPRDDAQAMLAPLYARKGAFKKAAEAL